jgi:hypothetical protein
MASEVEGRATSVVAAGPDSAAMRFDDRLADCQTHAAALWFGSKERIKYLLGVALGNLGQRNAILNRD